MIRLPAPTVGRALAHTGLTLGGAGGGLLAAITTDARAKAILVAAVVAGAVITNGLAKIFETLYKRRPEIIRAKGEKKAKMITAKAEAEALIVRTQTRAQVLLAGLEPGKAEPAAELLRMQSLDADLPEGRRLKDDLLAKLLAVPKARSGAGRPDSGGGPQDGESSDDGGQRVVRQIRVARADPPRVPGQENPLDPGDGGGSTPASGTGRTR
jgi:hypothetical protein